MRMTIGVAAVMLAFSAAPSVAMDAPAMAADSSMGKIQPEAAALPVELTARSGRL